MGRAKGYGIVVLLMLVAAVGCDSNEDDDMSEQELFLGAWTLTSISDDEGDQTASFEENVESFVVQFQDESSFQLNVAFVPDDPREDIQLAGTYLLDESDNALTLQIPGLPAPLSFTYAFENDNTLVLNASNVVLINTLFGTQYEGTVQITVERTSA